MTWKYCKGAIVCDRLCGDTMQRIRDGYGVRSFSTIERCSKYYSEKDVDKVARIGKRDSKTALLEFLALCGSEEMWNCQLAHHRCNSLKSDSLSLALNSI